MKTKLNKKELKNHINKNGFFTAAVIVKPSENMTEVEKEAYMPAAVKDQVPAGATYFKAIASNGELNRNGYIIRESAWTPAIQNYMENPVVLLQHDMNQPIGKVLTAHVGSEGLIISGYVFDELTQNRFSKGLFNAVSTGHITEGKEFVNSATGEILTEEQFSRLSWEEKNNPDWTIAVTSLDWLENSIVSIGANRKSLVKQRDVVKNYIESLRNEAEEIEEKEEEVEKEEKIEVEEKENEDDKTIQTEDKPVDEKVEEEKPDIEAKPAENAVKAEISTIVQLEVEEVKQASEALVTLANTVTVQKAEIDNLKNQISDLTNKLKNIPLRKGLMFTASDKTTAASDNKPKQENWLGPLLEANGVNVNK